tara:strand:+ start:5066 stop:5323 length:258 start_codon:yes stop_codon:yes gene_type:complete
MSIFRFVFDGMQAMISPFANEAREYFVEHAKLALAGEAVVDRLEWPLFGGGSAPSQPVPYDEDYPADSPAFINTWHPHATVESMV